MYDDRPSAFSAFGAVLILAVALYLGYVIVNTVTNKTYQQGYTDRYSAYAAAETAKQQEQTRRIQAQEQTRQVQEQEWGETVRTWSIYGSGALAVVAVVGVAGWGVVEWQRERSKRHEMTEVQTTQRVIIGSQRDVALAWIAANYPNAGYLPEARRPYVGMLDGVTGVFVPDLGEFVPADIARRELDASRLLVDGGRFAIMS